LIGGIVINKLKFLLVSLALLFAISGCSKELKDDENTAKEPAEKVDLMVSAAISLTDALEEIKAVYEDDHHVELTFNLGGSGSLAQQIRQGAPVDVFISANEEWMDSLEDEEYIVETTRKDITGNKVVLIAGKDSEINYDSVNQIKAEDVEQIAIGNPESTPVGTYTSQILQNLKLWDELESKFVLAKDVRQVLTYVETGNVDIGFVYESDALTSNRIKILATADQNTYDPVIYPATVLKNTQYTKEATDFVSFLSTDQAQQIFKKYGFIK